MGKIYHIQSGRMSGQLTLLKEIEKASDGHRMILARCGCGRTQRVILSRFLKQRQSCCSICAHNKHGFANRQNKHKLYRLWETIKRRCYSKNQKCYKNYGGRGIIISKRWINNPETFINDIEWYLGECPRGQSLDRIDNDGGYVISNLRWATPKQQANNRRKRKLYI